MDVITTRKSPQANRLEGFALTAIFQYFPSMTGAALLLKLAGSQLIVGQRYGVAIFVVVAAMFEALVAPWLGRKFPKRFGHGYEPLFFDASLSFSEKLARWRTQPKTSLQLVTSVMMLSLLAVGVLTMGVRAPIYRYLFFHPPLCPGAPPLDRGLGPNSGPDWRESVGWMTLLVLPNGFFGSVPLGR